MPCLVMPLCSKGNVVDNRSTNRELVTVSCFAMSLFYANIIERSCNY